MVAAVFHRVPVVTHITVLIAMCVLLLVLLPPNPPLYLTGLTTLFSCRLLFPNPVGPPSFSYIFNFLVTVRSLCNSPLNCICFPLHMPDMLLRSAQKRLSAVLLNGQIALERFKEIIFSSFFLFYNLFIFIVCVRVFCLHEVYGTHVCLVFVEAKRDYQNLWNYSYRLL